MTEPNRPGPRAWVASYPWTAGVATGLVVVLIALLITYLAGGFKAEPPYTTWCDSASAADGATVANRIYQSASGDIAVVAADKTC